MKKQIVFYFLLFFCIHINSQTFEPIYSVWANSISVKSKFIDNFFVEKSVNLTPYILKKTEILIDQSKYGKFSLELYKFNGYESEPGICNVISIKKDGNQILNLRNSNGFASISSYVNSESGDYSFIQLDVNNYVLIFNEWIYASQPSMVTIILIHNGNAQLVFNKPMFINSIKKSTGNLEIILQSNTDEYINDSNVPVNTPQLHTIRWDSGVLKYK